MYAALTSLLQCPTMKIVSTKLFLRHQKSTKALYLQTRTHAHTLPRTYAGTMVSLWWENEDELRQGFIFQTKEVARETAAPQNLV